ncbi:MAG TPA: peptide chain release factor-like protein [Phycisphaerales bacterium]|nr:peptide chain release factor-like protein [Phycisphaerales bacterium]
MLSFGVTERKARELLERMRACGLTENDLQETFVRASGPGGQKVNKTATCVVLAHRPTGLTVKMQKARTQALNRFYARRRMCELLEDKQRGQDSPHARHAAQIRKQKDRRRRRNRFGRHNNNPCGQEP